jgi:hypothetical protein
MHYGDMVFKSEFDHLDDALTSGIGGYGVLKKTCCKNIETLSPRCNLKCHVYCFHPIECIWSVGPSKSSVK